MKIHKKRWYVVLVIIIALLIGDISFFIMGKFFPNKLNEGNTQLPVPSEQLITTQKNIKQGIKDIKLNSPYAILIDLEDQSILYEKNADKKIYPASLTKVMSCVVALDHINDLNQKVTVTEKDLEGLAEANASVAGLQPGDEVTYEELLYALVLPSGADAANVLANNLCGDMKSFVQEMNNKAKAYGMVNTHFMNATGLHDDNHYTTMQDLKQMMKHAWINTAFQQVLTTTKYEIPSIRLKFKSTLLLYGDSLSFDGGKIIGGKSGYTLEAECCLVSVAKMEDGHLYMFISAKAPGEPLSDHKHIDDAKHMYEQVSKSK